MGICVVIRLCVVWTLHTILYNPFICLFVGLGMGSVNTLLLTDLAGDDGWPHHEAGEFVEE